MTVTDTDTALYANGGALLGVILEGEVGDSAEAAHAGSVLRALGVKPREAADIAHRALPEPG